MSVESASGCGRKGLQTGGFGRTHESPLKVYERTGTTSPKLAGAREGRRIYIWPATSAKADVSAKIIVKYQVPWKHLLIPGAGAPMEPEAHSGSD